MTSVPPLCRGYQGILLFSDSDHLRFNVSAANSRSSDNASSTSSARKTADDFFEKFAVPVTPKMG